MNALILNPYVDADWEHQQKGNFHTHCNRWGTGHSELEPEEVIDIYHNAGYTVLALTEHLTCVYPWENYDRDPDALNMVAVKGAELHYYPQHDVLCLYGDDLPNYGGNDFDISMNLMDAAGAIGIIAHPRAIQYLDIYNFNWYLNMYAIYPFLIGMEVFNPRYGNSECWWDALLTEFMPERPIWGFGNDDMHYVSQTFNKNRNTLLTELTDAGVKNAIEAGQSYFCTGDIATDIKINNIVVSENSIKIETNDEVEIEWITATGVVIATGDTLDFKSNKKIRRYVRARLLGATNNAYTQPFGFEKAANLTDEKIYPTAYPAIYPNVYPIS